MGVRVPFFSGGSCVPIELKVAWAEAYLRTKWHLSPTSRLATIKRTMAEKWGAVPLLGGAVTHSNTMSPEPTFTSVPSGIWIHPAVWPQ